MARWRQRRGPMTFPLAAARRGRVRPAWSRFRKLPCAYPGRVLGDPTAANHRLTATTGVVLVPLLGLVFLTGLAMDAYWHAHYVIGFVLIPVVALKMVTTGYRAARYYAGSAAYRAAGPPQIGLRLLAPFRIVGTTVALSTGSALFS